MLPQWMSLVQPFQFDLWIAFFLTLSLVAIFVMLYGAFYPGAELGPFDMLSYLSAVFVDESMSNTYKFKSNGIREDYSEQSKSCLI